MADRTLERKTVLLIKVAHPLSSEEKLELSQCADRVLLLNTNKLGEAFYQVETKNAEPLSHANFPFIISASQKS